MKKILSVILVAALTLSISVYSFAESGESEEAFVPKDLVIAVDEVQEVKEHEQIEELVESSNEEEDTEHEQNEDTDESCEEVVEEPEHCWCYDLTESDKNITYFRVCEECGVIEFLEEQEFYDLGGQYADCEKGRHDWCEYGYCELCGIGEE